MVPHAVVDNVLDQLKPILEKGDIVIEAGNSHYKESIRRYEEMKEFGVSYLDAGTSGGMEGARHGACYMVGGDADAWASLSQYSAILPLRTATCTQVNPVAVTT